MPNETPKDPTWCKVTDAVWDALPKDTTVEVINASGKMACGYVRQFQWNGLVFFRVLTPASMEGIAASLHLEHDIFSFLTRKYVQRADARQKRLGLVYTEAETHDLARELAGFIGTDTRSYH